jgi:hypothetical protein
MPLIRYYALPLRRHCRYALFSAARHCFSLFSHFIAVAAFADAIIFFDYISRLAYAISPPDYADASSALRLLIRRLILPMRHLPYY